MSDSSHVLADKSILSKFDQWFFKLEYLLNLLGGIVIFLVALLATVNVLGRWMFNLPISGYIDWVEQAMAFMAFLGIAYTMRLGTHIRMDIIIGRLKSRPLWIAEFISTLFMLMLSLILMYGSYLHFLRAYTIGDSSLDIGLAIWPSKLVVPTLLLVLSIRLMLQLWAYAIAIKKNSSSAIGVPVKNESFESYE